MRYKKTPYKPIRFSPDPWIRDASMRVQRMIGVDAGERLVLYCLASHVNRHGLCWPSRETIARETSQTERGVIRILKRLEQKRIIYRVARGGGCPGSCARYEWPAFSSTGEMYPIFVEPCWRPETDPVVKLATKLRTELMRIKSRRRSLGTEMRRSLGAMKLEITMRFGIESDVAI